MKVYRFHTLVARFGYKCLSILLLLAFLFSPQVILARASPPLPDGEEPLPVQTEPARTAAPNAAAAPRVAISCAALHEYTTGESLAQIADRYQVTVEELRQANPWLAFHPLQAECQVCIPAPAVVNLHAKAELYAALILGHLTIYGQGFPYDKRNPHRYRYMVKVMPNRSATWTKLGGVYADKGGKILEYFKLPKDIRYPRRLKVCLKELNTGWMICTWAQIIRV
jgi:LysM repeat protein